jgi:hypothetical protein
MLIEELLVIVDDLLTPNHLNSVQEMILYKCWEGCTYEKIAISSGYTPDYVRVAGSQLWQILSEALGEKVTKHNLRATLTRLQRGRKREHYEEALPHCFEVPEGAVALDSNFYVDRPPLEERCYREITKPGSLLRIKAPNQWGKTSLVIRILAQARLLNYQTVHLNFQQIEKATLHDLDRLMRWFCAFLSQQLHLEPRLDEYWDADLGSKVSCTNYIQNYLLPQVETALVLAMDDMERAFESTSIVQDFLPLLRFWHEESKHQDIWKKVRIIVTYSTEICIPLNINQSPFNVGLPILLPQFSLEQIELVAQHYHLYWNSSETKIENLIALHRLTQGHPYLVQLALYRLAQKDLSFWRFIQEASTEAGIYSHHLRNRLNLLQAEPELIQAFRKVVVADNPVEIGTFPAYKLASLGLIKRSGNEVLPSCDLYRQYFRDLLPS